VEKFRPQADSVNGSPRHGARGPVRSLLATAVSFRCIATPTVAGATEPNWLY